ncbi:hypothetical protein D9M68_915410 [compost metagenome]
MEYAEQHGDADEPEREHGRGHRQHARNEARDQAAPGLGTLLPDQRDVVREVIGNQPRVPEHCRKDRMKHVRGWSGGVVRSVGHQ